MPRDPYKYFRIEVGEILNELGQGALDLEKGLLVPTTVARLLRLAHTLKGAARVVKQHEIADRAHALEDALALFRDASGPTPRDRIDRVVSLVDEIVSYVGQLTLAPSDPETSPSDPVADQPLLAFRPAVEDLDALLGGVFEARVRLEALRPGLARVARARHVATLLVDQLSRSRDSEAGVFGSPRLNERVRPMADDLRGTFNALEGDLTSNIDHLDRELRQVGEAAERLRLAPARALFTFLERAARDVARALGKRVAFEASGGDVRVDTFVLNVAQGALLHIVRNAVAHGIEGTDAEGAPPERRSKVA